jgi:superfamily II DNA or RNA helicase/HKD family nuclease
LKSENNILNIENKELIYDVVAKELEYSDNCSTGDNDHLIYKLKLALEKAKRVDIIVAFLMESGVKLIEQDLLALANKNVPIRILTGNYLNITQPQALYLLKGSLGDKVDLRFYNVKNKSFHPKAYIFEYEEGGDIFIGSSNISRSALTSGIEWNYKISKSGQEEDFKHYQNVFQDLFLNQADIIDEEKMKEYSKNWRRPKVFVEVEKQEEEEKNKIVPMISPKGAQIEALYELNNSRLEGADKAIVVAATGVGKTYLAAFDSKHYSKILFVAHREEILNQAEVSFRKVRGNINTGFFTGNKKDESVEVLFATVQTLGQSQYLDEKYFKKDYFDYIIIDEFHHAVAGNYQNIINYFEPKFLLGLTATPERLDNKDVFALCDYNVVYEVRLKDAVNKGWLVPFRYYGIYDDTQYENIDNKNGKYNEKQLEKALMIEKRGTLIFKHYSKYKSEKALGFCSSRNHAEYMAKYFCDAGIKACAVYSGESGEYSLERKEALELLTNGELKVIFSVDMFNEGLDVPAVDLVMFLRPTESPTVFLQQLGRGLRKYKDKKYLNVLDFIGNYKKANLIPFFLTGDPKNATQRAKSGRLPTEEEYPDDCLVDFQLDIIDIFKRQAEAHQSILDFVNEEYYRIKDDLNHRPSRLEMFTYLDDDIYENIRKNSKLNIFNDFISFLSSINELDEDETKLINTKAFGFINALEKTQMSKSYKMPLLLAFYNNGLLKLKLTEDDVYDSFKEFYSKHSNAVDLLRDKAGKNFKEWGKKEYLKIAKNPQDAFLSSANDYFYKDAENYCLKDELADFKDNDAFLKHFNDVIEFRTRKFYKERLEGKYENL